jgi:hypothetical protein
MPDETPQTDTQIIEAKTSAKVQGIITGIVKGVAANWRDIAIGASLLLATYNKFEDSRHAALAQQQQGLLWHEAHHIEAEASIDPAVTETNKPTKTP